MNNLEKRIEKLENRTGTGRQVVFLVVNEGDNTKPTEAQREVAITYYKSKHPDWKEGDIIVLYWENGKFEG